jgi:hypothetical protein
MTNTETTNYLVVTYTTTYLVRNEIAGKTAASVVWSGETEIKFHDSAELARSAMRRRLSYLDRKGIGAGGQFYAVTEISDDVAAHLEFQSVENSIIQVIIK